MECIGVNLLRTDERNWGVNEGKWDQVNSGEASILEPVGQVGPRGGYMSPWAESLCKRVALPLR